jgi:predicted Zn-dependent protease
MAAVLACAGVLAASPNKVDTSTAVGRAFVRLYSFDFTGAQAILDRQIQADPQAPLPYSVKAAAYLFAELHRLKILQMDFFEDDDRVVDRKKLTPDPEVRKQFFRMVEMARERADARLATHPNDRDALFTHCMAAGLVTDYAALIERRRFGSFSLARKTQVWVERLMTLNPPVYDAQLAQGTTEYVLGSLPFFLRWFIRIHNVQGNKQKAVETLESVAARGRYYGPFARILLAVIHLREKRPWEAEKLLAELVKEYPENPLLKRELARTRKITGWDSTAEAAHGEPAQ